MYTDTWHTPFCCLTQWTKVNTLLLGTDEALNDDWNQNWVVEFVETHDQTLSPYSESDQSQYCFLPNAAFSPSFEEFTLSLVIDDETDEEQCGDAREMLGYDRDHPHDTEVVDAFNDYACDIDFTTVDHMSEGLAEPPVFTEVEFEAPE